MHKIGQNDLELLSVDTGISIIYTIKINKHIVTHQTGSFLHEGV